MSQSLLKDELFCMQYEKLLQFVKIIQLFLRCQQLN